jgi:uncharacterized protein (UPF0332 family)
MCEGKVCLHERSGITIKRAMKYLKSARILNRAFEKRQLGDYEYTFVISEDEAKEILENGEKFVEKIAQYLKEIKIL